VRTQRRHGMPIVNPLIFYPWRAYDFVKGAIQWGHLVHRYRRIRKSIQSDLQAKNYIDESLRPVEGANRVDEFVQVYADRIPKTYGAPVREAVAR
jgi:phage gp46-like protein